MPGAWTDLPPPPPLAPRPPAPAGSARPRVSVVMPTYRRAHLIGGTIRSILGQSFADFELLVRDDGKGDDGTEEAVRAAAAGDPRVKYHRNPKNLRMPANLNAGIEDASGELIAVCHDHDLYHPDFLAELVALLDRHPRALFAHTGIELVDQDDQPTGDRHVSAFAELTPGSEWLRTMLASFHCPVCALTLVRREAHERYGLYDPAYGFIADVEMWMRLSEHGDVAYAPKPLVRVRTREDGHEANENPWPIFATVFAIHRRYVPRSYRGIERLREEARLRLRADAQVLREIASRIRHGKRPRIGAAARPLGESTGPISRAVLRVLGPVEALISEVRS
ncbi:glycosyltransferase family 2 protein [Polyangium aurulentum]|uniref:glycosyltransferase family 2 protein n=1 Tax=Polyangium aurulentum TaxID=2567896 RepID=UPI0010AEA009|nr:glycosyltransferase [Polyangium aurulentum]UQA62386.1 glycosyltransferase [Polyangium aurulentum]